MKKKTITKRQKEVLKVIYNWIRNSGFPPSFNELKEELGVSSNQTILEHLINLEKKELIRREEGSARGIKILRKGYDTIKVKPLVPMFGTTSAGSFMEAIEEAGAWLTLSKDASMLSDDFFVIRVNGDSMEGAGIKEGDLILFQKTNEFYSGDIVLAQTNEGTTIKRFVSGDKPPYVYLKPENPKYNNILFEDGMKMIGKMIKKLQ